MKILFAMDASPTFRAAVNYIADRPWPKDTIIGILHVVTPINTGNQTAETEKDFEKRMEAAGNLVKTAGERLASKGFEVSTVVTQGCPRTAIIKYADLWTVDLVIIGSLGMCNITTFFLGSVAKKVMRECSCSVEILRPKPETDENPISDGMRILLATDGSEQSLAAILSITDRPWPLGSEIRVISVAEPLEPSAVNWVGKTGSLETMEEKAQIKAQNAIFDAEKILTLEGFNTSSVLLVGPPKDVIVDEARDWGADLIVVGTRGQHGQERILMGSVSDAVAIHAPCSVDVIRQLGS